MSTGAAVVDAGAVHVTRSVGVAEFCTIVAVTFVAAAGFSIAVTVTAFVLTLSPPEL